MRRAGWTTRICVIALGVVLAMFLHPVPGWADWTAPLNISNTPDFDADTGMAIDSAGNLHVAWANSTWGPHYFKLYYAKRTGGTWSVPVIFFQGSGQAAVHSIAVDSQFNVHVGFYLGVPTFSHSNQAAYIKFNGTSWSSPYYFSPSSSSRTPAVAVDQQDDVHVVWEGGSRCYYQKNDGTTWSTAQDIGGRCYKAKLVVDHVGHLHLAGGYNSTTYWKFDGAGWSAPHGVIGFFRDMVVDSQNRPHIVSGVISGAVCCWRIYYTTFDGSIWTTPVNITYYNRNGDGPSIAIDSNDHLHVFWNDYNNYPSWPSIVWYTSYDGNGWSIPVNVTPDASYAFTAISSALADSNDNLHLVYRAQYGDQANADIYYITTEPEVLNVTIDIKPGKDPNKIKFCDGEVKGSVKVAVLTTDDFDASYVNEANVQFAGAYPHKCKLKDVDHDGDDDLVCKFKGKDITALDETSTEATLTGETTDGTPITGTDSVLMKACGNDDDHDADHDDGDDDDDKDKDKDKDKDMDEDDD